MHAAAYALDPEFLLTANDIDDACQQGLFTVIERLMIRDVILKHECDISTPEKLEEVTNTYNNKHPEVIGRVAQCEREYCMYKNRDAPFNRAAVLHNAVNMSPSRWWDLYGGHIPLMQRVAQRVLAQVASAFAAERNWSIYGQIKNDKRVRMGHSVGDARVYCHEAIQLHDKLHQVRDAVVSDDEFACDDNSDDDDTSGGDDEDEEAKELAMLMR